MSPTISVVIPAYNAAHLLDRSIASVLDQSHPVDEVLVVDDGSSDNTAEVVARYDAPVRLVSKPNGGAASARNAGVRAATSEWIAFLDADDRWLPEKVERVLALAAGQPEAGLLYTDAEVIGLDGRSTGRFLEDKGPVTGWAFERLLSSFFVLPSTVVARRSLLIEAGLFNETMRHAEDYDLCLRLARLTQFALLPEALTLYQRQPNSLTTHLLAEDEAHIPLFRRLLADGQLSASQRATIERRLAQSLFARAYQLRAQHPAAAVRASCQFLAHYPAQPSAWKLAAGSLAAGARRLIS